MEEVDDCPERLDDVARHCGDRRPQVGHEERGDPVPGSNDVGDNASDNGHEVVAEELDHDPKGGHDLFGDHLEGGPQHSDRPVPNRVDNHAELLEVFVGVDGASC